jgi:anti-sigma factor RsiW
MCGKFEALWIPYLDGKLDDQERALMLAHLGECAECAQRQRDYVAVSQALSEWEAPAPSPWFDARLRRRIAEDQARRAWLPGLTRWVAAASASIAALLLLACLLIFSGHPKAVQPQPSEFTDEARMEEVLHAADEVELLNNFEALSALTVPEGKEQKERQ